MASNIHIPKEKETASFASIFTKDSVHIAMPSLVPKPEIDAGIFWISKIKGTAKHKNKKEIFKLSANAIK